MAKTRLTRPLASAMIRPAAVLAAASLLPLGGCSGTVLWPTADQVRPQTVIVGPIVPQESPVVLPASGLERMGSPSDSPISASVTDQRNGAQRLRERAMDHGDRLATVRTEIVNDAAQYHGTKAAIEARLHVGTAADNPTLVAQYETADAALMRLGERAVELEVLADAVDADIVGTDRLAIDVGTTARLPDAIDEDRRQLSIIEAEISQVALALDRLAAEIDADIRRQQRAVASERVALAALAFGIARGETYGADLAAAPAGVAPASIGRAADRAIVTIRFTDESVAYEEPLSAAVDAVLSRDPAARFDVVAVAPDGSDPDALDLDRARASRHADDVRRALIGFGVAPARVQTRTTASAATSSPEVRVFVR